MIKHGLFIFLSFLYCTLFCNGQTNLVHNPSFEDTIKCPTFAEIGEAVYWTNPTQYSPDYYNSCVPSTGAGDGFSVPNNWYGTQIAKTGNAYAGIIDYCTASDCREYIQGVLNSSLIANKIYCVQFYVSAADSTPYASNNIGAYFSNTAITANHSLNLPYTQQISNNPNTNPLTDRVGWTKVSGMFTAQGGEKYITIGNFNDDANTDTTDFNYTTNVLFGWSYHFIDDVLVYYCDPDAIKESSLENKVKIFPNPSNSFFTIEFGEILPIKATVYNHIGQEIISINRNEILKKNAYTLDMSLFENGIYFLKIKTSEGVYNTKIIINH